jgi:hypothetical protein
MTVVIDGTNGITGVNGTAAAPAMTGTDTDTGVVYGTNTLSLATGGTTAVTIDASQRAQFLNTIGVGNATPSTSGAGITFPATQSASSDANTLDDYEEGTFTFTGTGFTTTPTGTAYYTKIGDQVTLRIPDITGTSNTTAMTITGLPVGLRSNAAYTSYARVYNASTTYNGHLYGGQANTIEVYFDPAESAFTASGVKGITNKVNFSYTLT